MKKLLVVLSLVMVLAFAGSSLAATVGHGGVTITFSPEAVSAQALQAANSLSDAEKTALASVGFSVVVGADNSITITAPATTNMTKVLQKAMTGIRTGQKALMSAAAKLGGLLAKLLRGANVASSSEFVAAADSVQVAVAISADVAAWKANGVESFKFYPQIETSPDYEVTNGDMYLMYKNSGDSTFTNLTTANVSSMNNDAKVVLGFYFNGNPATGGIGRTAFANPTVDSVSPAVVAVTKASSSSGGETGGDTSTDEDNEMGSSSSGCVAGTSALALAVLGMFIAKGKK